MLRPMPSYLAVTGVDNESLYIRAEPRVSFQDKAEPSDSSEQDQFPIDNNNAVP